MNYNFTNFEKEVTKVEDYLKKEFLGIRTGQATPSLLDSISIDSFGSKTPIQHVASINVENPKTLRVTPWDKGQIKDIERAIMVADLGVSVVSDGEGARVIFPDLTTERREMLKKLIKDKLESAKTSLKGEREKVWNEIQKQEKEGGMSEDDKFKSKDDLQKIVDEVNKKLDKVVEKKNLEISE